MREITETFSRMEEAVEAARAEIVKSLQSGSSRDTSMFREEVIAEIVRRLRSMTNENFVSAACDILQASRLDIIDEQKT